MHPFKVYRIVFKFPIKPKLQKEHIVLYGMLNNPRV